MARLSLCAFALGEFSHLITRMLPNNKYPIPQREPLTRIIRDRRIQRGVSDRNASRRRNPQKAL